MDIMFTPDYASIFASGFAWVFLLGIQQQNITGEHHVFSAFTSYALALAFIVLIQGMAQVSVPAFVLLYGTGSALGASLSIFIHKSFVRRPE